MVFVVWIYTYKTWILCVFLYITSRFFLSHLKIYSSYPELNQGVHISHRMAKPRHTDARPQRSAVSGTINRDDRRHNPTCHTFTLILSVTSPQSLHWIIHVDQSTHVLSSYWSITGNWCHFRPTQLTYFTASGKVFVYYGSPKYWPLTINHWPLTRPLTINHWPLITNK